MTLEEAMQHWRNDDAHPHATTMAMTLDTVKREAHEFDHEIRRRDRREVIAATVVFAFFVFVLLHPSWVTRIGALLVLAGCISTFWHLRQARTVRPPARASEPLGRVLHIEHERVEAQIRLLQSVLWWYIAPFAVGTVLVFAGAAGVSWSTAVYAAVVAALAAFIYRLNRSAVRRELVPRRERLAGLLRDIEG